MTFESEKEEQLWKECVLSFSPGSDTPEHETAITWADEVVEAFRARAPEPIGFKLNASVCREVSANRFGDCQRSQK